MKKFEFSLGRMLDYRQSLLEKEKNTLMQLFARRSAMEDSLEVNGQQQQQTAEELRMLTQRGTTIAEIQRIDFRLEAMRRQAEQLQKDLAAIELAIDRQRDVVTEVSQQVKGLELLRENQLEEYNYAARKEEEDRIAELISSKIARQQH
ncbi:MAG: flagellar FliJ family protein [Angelakisella sp.]